MVRMVGVVGPTLQGDIAIDLLRLHDPSAGCKDPTADNYDQFAEIDDGSCVYTNCTFLTLNMYDSFGDGWNGNFLSITNSNGVQFYSTTIWPIPNGFFQTESFCVPNDECYSLTVGGVFGKMKFLGTEHHPMFAGMTENIAYSKKCFLYAL